MDSFETVVVPSAVKRVKSACAPIRIDCWDTPNRSFPRLRSMQHQKTMKPNVNTPTTAVMPPPVPQTTVPRVQNTRQTRPAPVVPPLQLSSAPSAIPPVVTSQTPSVGTAPPSQSTPKVQEEPAAIVIQVRPSDSPQTPLNASLETEVKSPESEKVPQNQNDESPPSFCVFLSWIFTKFLTIVCLYLSIMLVSLITKLFRFYVLEDYGSRE